MERKIVIYEELLSRSRSLLGKEKDIVANMANLSALIKEAFGFHWVGFYIVKGDELVLGPFQGPVACTRIKKGRGVCGTAWEREETVIVADVEQFPGHIACSALSKSEIVVPVFDGGSVIAVLDIDSDELGQFDDIDGRFLGEIVTLIKQ